MSPQSACACFFSIKGLGARLTKHLKPKICGRFHTNCNLKLKMLSETGPSQSFPVIMALRECQPWSLEKTRPSGLPKKVKGNNCCCCCIVVLRPR